MSVEIVDFPFTMSTPDFGGDIEAIDGTVLYLNSLWTGDDNSVVLKSFSEDDLIHLVAPNEVSESGIIGSDMSALPSDGMEGYYYYTFPDDVKVYSEQALVVLVAEGG